MTFVKLQLAAALSFFFMCSGKSGLHGAASLTRFFVAVPEVFFFFWVCSFVEERCTALGAVLADGGRAATGVRWPSRPSSEVWASLPCCRMPVPPALGRVCSTCRASEARCTSTCAVRYPAASVGFLSLAPRGVKQTRSVLR